MYISAIVIRIEYSGELFDVNPPDAYHALITLYPHFPDTLEKYGLQYPDGELQPDARLLKLDNQKHGLVLKIKKPSRISPQGTITALLIQHPTTPLSDHIASFKLTEQRLLSLNLPGEYIFVEDSPIQPGKLFSFHEKHSAELPGPMTIWFLDIAISKTFIPPPKLYINNPI